MAGRLHGRTAVVFGGGRGPDGPTGQVGIGFACVSAYAAQDARVVVVDRDGDAANRSSTAVVEAGGMATAVVADMTDEGAVGDAVTAALAAYGQIDIVQNNVGVTHLAGVEEMTLEEWNAAVRVNLDSVFLGARATLPHLLETRGAMVNVSSTASIRWTGFRYPAYAAAKAAVNQLTQSMALQYAAAGVRINAILAGLIDTPLAYRELSGGLDAGTVQAQRAAHSPTGTLGTAEDIAHTAVFLASDEAAYITGALIPVDGGLHARVIP